MTGEGPYTDARWMELNEGFLSLFFLLTLLWHNFRCRKRFQEQCEGSLGTLRPNSSHVPVSLPCFAFSRPFPPHRGGWVRGVFWPTWGGLQVWCPQILRTRHSLAEPQPSYQTGQSSQTQYCCPLHGPGISQSVTSAKGSPGPHVAFICSVFLVSVTLPTALQSVGVFARMHTHNVPAHVVTFLKTF